MWKQDSNIFSVNQFPLHQWRTDGVFEGGGVQTPHPTPKFRRPSKTVPNCENCQKLLNLGRQHPKMFGKKGSKILKLPPVRNCFTLAMTNKLVDIIDSLKVPKIKKILLYEMKVLVPNYSCLQNPWLGGYRPQTPVLSVLCLQLNLLIPPPEQNSWVRPSGKFVTAGKHFCQFCHNYLLKDKNYKEFQNTGYQGPSLSVTGTFPLLFCAGTQWYRVPVPAPDTLYDYYTHLTETCLQIFVLLGCYAAYISS